MENFIYWAVSIVKIMNRERKENRKSIFCIYISFFYLKFTVQTALLTVWLLQNIQHEDGHCIFCNNIPRFLYILVSYTVAVSPCQSSDWYRQTANNLQGDVSCDYLWIVLQTANSFCTGNTTHQQWLGESQEHPIYILRDLSGLSNIFGKHCWWSLQQQMGKVATTICLCVS